MLASPETGQLVSLLDFADQDDPRNPFDDNPQTPNSLSFVMPGSSLKGPLAHRTLFHRNRLLPDGQGMIDAGALDALNDRNAIENKKTELGAQLQRAKGSKSGIGAAVWRRQGSRRQECSASAKEGARRANYRGRCNGNRRRGRAGN
jgi:hypothetical protein